MRTLVTILLFSSNFVAGQSRDSQEVIQILNLALQHDKLPAEIINRSRDNIAMWTNDPFVVVKSDEDLNFKRTHSEGKKSHVWILDYEDIFLMEIQYGLVPVAVKRSGNKLTFDYKTIRYPSKDELTTKCHKGRLVAEKVNDNWTILTSKLRQKNCEIDLYGQKK